MNIGLTGGIATGKSTVSSMLAERGAIVVDADAIAREVVAPGHPVLDEVVRHFGQAILREDGSLDRQKLGQIVFQDAEKRKELERIMHPAIRSIMLERMHEAEKEHPDTLVVADVPLLYESDIAHLFDEVMVVYAPRHVQLKRLMERNGLNEEEARARIEAQMDIELKKAKADIVIDNSGSLQDTEQQVDRFWTDRGLKSP